MKKVFYACIVAYFSLIQGLNLMGQSAQVQVIHNSADPLAEIVDLYIQYDHEEVKLDDVAFQSATPFLELPAATPINIIVSPANSESSEDQIKAFHNIRLKDGENYQVIANGVLDPHSFSNNPDHRNTAFNLFILPGARVKSQRPNGRRVDIRAFHGVTDAPNVGASLDGNVLVRGFSYGQLTHYGSIRNRNYRLDIFPGHQPRNILFSYEADLSELGGQAGLLLPSGFLDPTSNQDAASFEVLLVLADGTVITLPSFEEVEQIAKVQVIHNSADPAAEVVDIYIQYDHEEVKLDDVAFRSATPFLELPSNTNINIIISPADSRNAHDRIKAFHNIRLEAGESYQVIANGLLSHQGFSGNPDHKKVDFDLFLLKNAREQAEDSELIDVRIFHGATDAPTVGVNANWEVIVPGFSYGDITDYLSIPPASYRLDITPGDSPEEVLLSYLAELESLAGGAAIVLASGFLDPSQNSDGADFALIAVLPDGTVIILPPFEEEEEPQPTAQVQVIHNAADPAAATVDIYVDTGSDTLKVDDFSFRSATPFIELPAETDITIVIAGPNSTSIEEGIATFSVSLENGESYYVVANGVLDPSNFAANPEELGTAFTLLVEAGARQAAEEGESVDLKVLHGATDAPGVGVNANGATIIPSFSYADFTDYLSVPAAFYQLDITLGNQPEAIVASFDAEISGLGGGAALILASGFLDPSSNQDGEAFGLIAVLPDGSVIILPASVTVPPTAQVQVIHNAADPAATTVDIYVDTGSDTIKINNFEFRSATPFLELPAETEITIVIAGPNSESIEEGIATFNVILEKDESYYVVANGVLAPANFAANPEELGTAFTLLVEAGARQAAEEGESVDLKVLHGATDAPGVGVNANGATIIPSFSYADFTDYLSVPADFYQLDITLGNQPEAIVASFDAEISGLGGGAALVLASGFLDPAGNQEGEAFGLIAVLPDGSVIILPASVPPTAQVQVIHNAADPGAQIVDIYVNTGSDTIKVDDFAFRSATPFIELPAETELSIVIAGSNSESIEEGLATFNVILENGESYYVVANGVLDPSGFAPNPEELSTAFTLLVQAGARQVTENSQTVDLQVLHGATDAPNVGVNANGATIIPGFSYGEFVGYLSVPADNYLLEITPGGDSETVIAAYSADLNGLGGVAALVIASGFLDSTENQGGEAFGLIAVLPDGNVVLLPAPGISGAQFINNSADPAMAMVDIYIETGEEQMKVEDLIYQNATPFLDLPAEVDLKISIADAQSQDSDEGVQSFNIRLESGKNYYLVANGVMDPSQFSPNPNGEDRKMQLFMDDEARRITSGQEVAIKVFHGITDAPELNLYANSTTLPLVNSLGYGEFSPYYELFPTNIEFSLVPQSGNTERLSGFETNLLNHSGTSGLLLLSGFMDPSSNDNGSTMDLLFAHQNGQTDILSATTSQDTDLTLDNTLLSVYPNPVVNQAKVEYELPQSGSVSFELVDILGKRVDAISFENQVQGFHTWNLDSKNLQVGIHTLIMTTGSVQSVQRLMIKN